MDQFQVSLTRRWMAWAPAISSRNHPGVTPQIPQRLHWGFVVICWQISKHQLWSRKGIARSISEILWLLLNKIHSADFQMLGKMNVCSFYRPSKRMQGGLTGAAQQKLAVSMKNSVLQQYFWIFELILDTALAKRNTRNPLKNSKFLYFQSKIFYF